MSLVLIGKTIPDEEWEKHDAERRPKPRRYVPRIRYDNLRPIPKQVGEGLSIAMAYLDEHARRAKEPLPPTDPGWWEAIEDASRWERG